MKEKVFEIVFQYDKNDSRHIHEKSELVKACAQIGMTSFYTEKHIKNSRSSLALFFHGNDTDAAEGISIAEDFQQFILNSNAWHLYKVIIEGR